VGQLVADLDQHLLVGGKARQQAVGGALEGQLVGGGQALAVLRHLVGGEQLQPQRRFLAADPGAERGVLQLLRPGQ
jgi:hypothetical protein